MRKKEDSLSRFIEDFFTDRWTGPILILLLVLFTVLIVLPGFNQNKTDKGCVIHYNESQRAQPKDLNSSFTWYGPIEFLPNGGSVFYYNNVTLTMDCNGETFKLK